MSKPQVFVYLDKQTKAIVKDVSQRLGMAEAELFRALSLPHVRQIRRALRKGADPDRLKRKLLERVEEMG